VSTPARVVTRVPVSWPEAARREGISGAVVVSVRVGRDGRVRETRLANSIPGLDEAAIFAVRRYEFTPANDGVAEVESWVLVPVRFDASLPAGTRGTEPVNAGGYGDAQRTFESDVEVLRQHEPVAPNEETFARHERIMSEAMSLEMIPTPGDEAIRAFLRGDSLGRSQNPALREGRRMAWAEAAYAAPWWPLPYRRLASLAIAERDFPTASACARVILAGRSSDEEALAILKRVGQLRWAEAPKRSQKSKKK